MSDRAAVRAEHYLPHVQGLRAIAVLLVVLFHVWPGRLTGGYVGVDVFFVISGFLITGQLARELEATGRVRLGEFWAKRARRLLPAAILVLVASAILVLTVMPVSSLPESVREILASTFYVENWALVATSADYLAGAQESIAQHYWSLSLEEQFYVIWPLLLISAIWLGLHRIATRRGALVAMIGAVTVVTFVLCVWLTAVAEPQSYFNTFTRMWEFGVGGLLALLPVLRPRARWANALIGFAGIALVLGAGWFFDQQTPFPGWYAAIPVVGTAMAIAATRADAWWLPATWLAIPPARWIGDISYSMYLWHWPLIVVAPFIPGWSLEWYNRVALIAITILLAWATKRFVEDPFRRWPFLTRHRARRTAVASVVLMAISALVVGGVWLVRDGQYRAEGQQLAAAIANPPDCFGAAAATGCANPELEDEIIPSWGFAAADEPSRPECLATLNDAELRPCRFGSDDPAAPRIALIGDSHAYQYIETMIDLAEQQGWALTTYLKGACPWNAVPLAVQDEFGRACAEYQSRLAEELGAGEPFDAVVTAALATTEFDGGPGADPLEWAVAGYAKAWLGADAPIVAIVDNPSWPENPNMCLRQQGSASACTVPRGAALADPDPIALAAGIADAVTLDLTRTYCGEQDCWSVIGGVNVYRDRDHLTLTWVTTMAPFLRDAVGAALAR